MQKKNKYIKAQSKNYRKKEHNQEEMIQVETEVFKKTTNWTSKGNQRNQELYKTRDER